MAVEEGIGDDSGLKFASLCDNFDCLQNSKSLLAFK